MSDGTTLRPGEPGQLVTGSSVWTFDSSLAPGGHLILRNGEPARGAAVMMKVANEGQIYALDDKGDWYIWRHERWVETRNPNALKLPSKWRLSLVLLGLFLTVMVLTIARIVPPEALSIAAVAWLALIFNSLRTAE